MTLLELHQVGALGDLLADGATHALPVRSFNGVPKDVGCDFVGQYLKFLQ